MTQDNPTPTPENSKNNVAPLILTSGADFMNAVDALPEAEQTAFWAAYGQRAAKVISDHVKHLQYRMTRAREVAKTATGMKRRRAKEMKFTTQILKPRVEEAATAAMFGAWKASTGRDIVFAPEADADGVSA